MILREVFKSIVQDINERFNALTSAPGEPAIIELKHVHF